MAEDVENKDGGDDIGDDEIETKDESKKEPEVLSVEDLAMKIGWNPNHESDDREFLSAADYILKSKEIQATASKTLKKQSREMMELKNAFKALEEHNKAVYKAQTTQLKNEIAELRARRKEADEEGNHILVNQLDGQIKEMSDIPTELPETGQQLHPAFQPWLDDNDWYENDDELRAYADMVGEQPEYRAIAQKDYPQFLKKVEGAVKKVFSEKFKPAPKPTRAPVEPATQRSLKSGNKLSYNNLTRDQQDICDQFVKLGVMTREKYLEDLEIKMNAS